MPDRIIRDELLQSERWLDLPTDTHRLVYTGLLLRADDYGNLEGGPRRLYRWMHAFTQVKNEADSIKVMSDLQDAGLVLRYEVENKEYWHIARFKNSRWYWTRRCPQSPYSDDNDNEKKQRPSEKRDTHVAHTLPTRREGVGVGVGEKLYASGSSKSPTRQVKPRLKHPPGPEATPESIAREKRVAALLVEGDLEQAKKVKAGLA